MRALILACAFCLVRAGCAYGLEGDPFADGQQDFSSLQKIETPNSLVLGGFVESRNQLALHHFNRPVSLRQKLQVEALWRRDALSLFGNFEGSYEGAAQSWQGEHAQSQAGPRELYLTWDTDAVDVFLGRKIHRWGTGDGINPMDLINPLDTKDPMATGRADNRVPVCLLDATFSWGKHSLEGVVLPRAGVNALPRYGNPWEPLALHTLRSQSLFDGSEEPDEWLRDMEFGSRFSSHLAGWDLALMAFRGFVDNPMFVSGTSNMARRAEYPSFSAFGLSFAKGFGGQTVRGEAACKPRFPLQEPTGFDRADLWQTVLGWDYDLDSKYYLNFQVFGDYQEGGRSSGDQTWHGAAYEISGKWLRDALKTGVRGKWYTSGDGALTELFLEYEVDDHWKAASGFMFWTGKKNSLMGQYRENDLFSIIFRYSF